MTGKPRDELLAETPVGSRPVAKPRTANWHAELIQQQVTVLQLRPPVLLTGMRMCFSLHDRPLTIRIERMCHDAALG